MKKKNACIANLEGVLSVFVVLIHAASTNINVPGRELQSINGLNKTFPRYRTIGSAHRSDIRYQTMVR